MNPSSNYIPSHKTIQLIIFTAIFSWILGYAIAFNLAEIVTNIIGKDFFLLSANDLLVMSSSLGFLLCLCTICSGFILVVYSRNQDPSYKIFFSSLIVLIVISGAGIFWHSFQARILFQAIDLTPDGKLSYSGLHFFSWGSPYLILATIILIFIAYRKRQALTPSNLHNE